MGEETILAIVAPLIVLASPTLLFARKAVHVAAGMIVVMIGIAVLYFALEAPFVGMVQIIVYTGAIMMLILFVLMLVGVDQKESLKETIKGQRWVALACAAGLAFLIIWAVRDVDLPINETLAQENTAGDNARVLAGILFGNWVLVIEILGLLLVVAAIGAVVLTHVPSGGWPVQAKKAGDRVVSRLNPVNRPMPGVRARRNALDVPALGPDGRPLEASESRILKARRRGIAEMGDGGSTHPLWRVLMYVSWFVLLVAGVALYLWVIARRVGEDHINPMDCLGIAAILFSIGAAAVLLRRNAIVALMGIELMLNASNFLLVAFARSRQDLNGQALALFAIVVAAAEVVVGLALIIVIFRSRQDVSLDGPQDMKG